MTLGSSPLVRRRRLGAEFRKLRDEHKLTNEQVATRMGWSVAKLSRLENAKVRPDLVDVMDLLDQYGVTGPQRENLMIIARDAAAKGGWWDSITGDIPRRQGMLASLENGAIEICEFQQALIPGLLQTPDYARTRFSAGASIGAPPTDVDAAANARLARQQILRRDAPLAYQALIDETVLVRRCGERGVRGAQLSHLLEAMELPTVELRIVPHDADVDGFYIPPGSFSLYRFADPDDPDVVVLETETSTIQLGDEEDSVRYRRTFECLWKAAFSESDTVALLEVACRDSKGS